MAADNLTTEARAGYDGNENIYLATSPCWYAHRLGHYLHDTGRSPPTGVRMGRGSKVHSNGMTFEYSTSKGWERIK